MADKDELRNALHEAISAQFDAALVITMDLNRNEDGDAGMGVGVSIGGNGRILVAGIVNSMMEDDNTRRILVGAVAAYHATHGGLVAPRDYCPEDVIEEAMAEKENKEAEASEN